MKTGNGRKSSRNRKSSREKITGTSPTSVYNL
jgi:hypothetical protein